MKCGVSLKPTRDGALASATLPDFRAALVGAAEPAVAPTKEPETAPVKPDVEPEPNTVPHRDPVPEPDVPPCERPDTSCPVHR